MALLNGKLVGGDAVDYTGYRTSLSFQQGYVYTPEVDDPNGPDQHGVQRPPLALNLPTEASTAVSADGTFTVSIPEHTQPPFELQVYAPSGVVLVRHTFTAPISPKVLPLEVPDPRIFAVAAQSDKVSIKPLRVTGRVIDQDGNCEIAETQLVVWAHRRGTSADAWQPVAMARTDAQGYFASSYSGSDYDAAYVVVMIGAELRQPIAVDDGLLARDALLVVELSDKDVERLTACGQCRDRCKSTVPRAPTSEDLVSSSSTYSNDLVAGQCVNFTIPNRTLEEHDYYAVVRTTEPVIKGLTIPEARVDAGIVDNIATLEPNGASAQIRSYRREATADWLADVAVMTTPGRAALTAAHPLQWEVNPTFYQATTIAHGHILHFRQTWNADGYSLGDLLYSLPLAPCEKKQVAIVDWTRREAARRDVAVDSADALTASLTNNRDLSEIYALALAEGMRGASHSSNWGVGGGLGGAGSFGAGGYSLGAVIGVSAGGGGSDSSAWQDSSKSISASALQSIRNNVMQAASSVRNLRTSVVTTVEQGEQVRAETSVVANHNHCHALTIEYFEVLRHYLVRQHLADVRECLFIPLLMSTFDSEGRKALRWRAILESRLKRPQLSIGFDAIDRILHGWEGSDLPAGRFADERVTAIDGEMTIRCSLPRPADAADGGVDLAAWTAYNIIAGVTSAYFYDLFLKDYKTVVTEKDRVFREEIAPIIAKRFVERLTFQVYTVDTASAPTEMTFSLLTPYAENTPLKVSIRGRSTGTFSRAAISFVQIAENFAFEAPSPPRHSSLVVEEVSLRYRTAHLNHALVAARAVDERLVNEDAPGYPSINVFVDDLDTAELRNPHAEDEAARRALVAHLNEFIEYYHRVIWWDMDPERRYMLLDGARAPDGDGRSVASVVENRLIGIVGNSLVMPVALGFKLDPTYELPLAEAETGAVGKPVSLLDLYAPSMPAEPMRISVPTAGVFAEAVMGSCNSCEEIKTERFWKFEEHPCGDEPTPIQSPSTDTRRADPGSLEAPALPAPIINMQTAPALPDLTGLSAALQVLGAASPFRDMAGLTQTQKNAYASMDAALKAAEYFGGTAAQLAQGAQSGGQKGAKGIGDIASQQQAANNIDKTMRTIDESQAAGHLTKEQAGELKQSAIKQMIGSDTPDSAVLDRVRQAQEGGLIGDADAREISAAVLRKQAGLDDVQHLTDEPDVSRLLQAAADDGRGVTLGRLGEAVTVESGASTSVWPVTLYSVEFVSDHQLLTDHDTDWDAGGDKYSKPEWIADLNSIGSPVSHTKNTKVTLKVRVRLSPTSAETNFDLHGDGPDGMKFDLKSMKLVPGVWANYEVTSNVTLPDKILAIDFKVAWKVQGPTPGDSYSIGTSINPMYITYGTPKVPRSPMHPDEFLSIGLAKELGWGVTLKRMKQAVKMTSSTGSVDPHVIVRYLHKQFQSANATIYKNAWELADHTSAECETIVRYQKYMIDMVGLAGDAAVKVVWSHPEHPETAIENDYPTPNIGNPNVSYYDLKGKVWKGTSESHSKNMVARLFRGASSNLYEACLKFTYPPGSATPSDTKYYAGGADVYDTASGVLHFFTTMEWEIAVGVGKASTVPYYDFNTKTFAPD